jgi:hypothetical protein
VVAIDKNKLIGFGTGAIGPLPHRGHCDCNRIDYSSHMLQSVCSEARCLNDVIHQISKGILISRCSILSAAGSSDFLSPLLIAHTRMPKQFYT